MAERVRLCLCLVVLFLCALVLTAPSRQPRQLVDDDTPLTEQVANNSTAQDSDGVVELAVIGSFPHRKKCPIGKTWLHGRCRTILISKSGNNNFFLFPTDS